MYKGKNLILEANREQEGISAVRWDSIIMLVALFFFFFSCAALPAYLILCV